MGAPTLAAHFFVFYFGIVADITPPVALAAYAGSAIAKANPEETAFKASKLAIAVFIVPYVFNPAMLLIDTTPLKVVQIFITSLIGVFGLSSSLEGFSVKMCGWWGLMLIYYGDSAEEENCIEKNKKEKHLCVLLSDTVQVGFLPGGEWCETIGCQFALIQAAVTVWLLWKRHTLQL